MLDYELPDWISSTSDSSTSVWNPMSGTSSVGGTLKESVSITPTLKANSSNSTKQC